MPKVKTDVTLEVNVAAILRWTYAFIIVLVMHSC